MPSKDKTLSSNPPNRINKVKEENFDSSDELMKAYDEMKHAQRTKSRFAPNINQKKQFYNPPSLFEPLIDTDGEIKELTRNTNPFHLLGAYPQPKIQIPYEEDFEKTKYHKVNYALFNDEDYCEKVDYYNLVNPRNIFMKQNFFSDYSRDSNIF